MKHSHAIRKHRRKQIHLWGAGGKATKRTEATTLIGKEEKERRKEKGKKREGTQGEGRRGEEEKGGEERRGKKGEERMEGREERKGEGRGGEGRGAEGREGEMNGEGRKAKEKEDFPDLLEHAGSTPKHTALGSHRAVTVGRFLIALQGSTGPPEIPQPSWGF